MSEPQSEFGQKDIVRAVELMANAGWIEKSRVTTELAETWFTEKGLIRAKQLLEAFLELDTRSDRDLRSVLGVLLVVLRRDIHQ